MIGARPRELYLSPSAFLQVGKMLAAASNECTVLRHWYFYAKYNTVEESLRHILEFGLELAHDFGITA